MTVGIGVAFVLVLHGTGLDDSSRHWPERTERILDAWNCWLSRRGRSILVAVAL